MSGKIKVTVYKERNDEYADLGTRDFIPDENYLKENFGYGTFRLYVYVDGFFRDKKEIKIK
jgi:hypothetical protein